jgi:predicted membrane-bound mannosyltransferase
MTQSPLSSRPAANRIAGVVLLVLAIAVALRAWHLSTWSMWEDEEGSITLAQKPFHGFQGYFPIFFVALNQIMQVTSPSVVAARVFPAVMGVLSVALTYFCFRRYASRQAAVLAALFLALNIGHIFFSQSIRYYTTALVFQLLSMYWFLDGFERGQPWALVLSLLALVAALLTHFSALLLVPVFVGYLLLAAVRSESEAGYRPRYYLVFGLALTIILVLFVWRATQLRGMIGGWRIPSARDPVHVGATALAYFGLPVIGLALMAPMTARELSPRVRLFLLTAAFVPVLELLVIAWLDVVNVTWYYALIALIGLALLAGAALVGLWQSGRRVAAGLLGGAAVGYYVVFLGGYHLAWHGDRPRWDEAAHYLAETAGVRPDVHDNPYVYASVPGVVAYYLGADPRQPETYHVVEYLPDHPAPPAADRAGWYVVEAKVVSPEYESWFAKHCELRARFDAHTGPIDRSVLVYQYVGAGPKAGMAASVVDTRDR